MELRSSKVKVNRSKTAMETYLQDPANFQNLMPDNLSSFECTDSTFSFMLKGLPKVTLQKKSGTNPSDLIYESIGIISFELSAVLESIDNETTEATLIFDGKINPMMQLMIKKPLHDLLETFSTKLAQMV